MLVSLQICMHITTNILQRSTIFKIKKIKSLKVVKPLEIGIIDEKYEIIIKHQEHCELVNNKKINLP